MKKLEKVGFVRHGPIVYDGEPAEFFAIDTNTYETLNTG